MILLDTSGVLAAVDSSHRAHAAARDVLLQSPLPLVLSPFVLAELDYLISTRVGRRAQSALLVEVANGAYDLATFTARDVESALEVIVRFADHDIGLADASIVVLADRLGTTDVLTLDERHFRTLRTTRDLPFRLLPGDG